MANTTILKRRIQSVKNTRQITKAMELVSASKMRRAQEHAVRSREYRKLARHILGRLSEVIDIRQHPLYVQRKVTRRLYVVITSDRGLAGAYNSNVLRRLTTELKADRQANIKSSIILIGKKGASFVSRLEDVETEAVYEHFPEQPTANDIRPVLETVVRHYQDNLTDAVDVIYTDYISSVNQEVKVDRLLPAVFHADKEYAEEPAEELSGYERVAERLYKNREASSLQEVIVEPSPKVVLEQVTERLVDAQLTQDIVESQASEQSMRMMAMKSATDNANELESDLTLEFNTARQAAITQELAEITGGAEAIK